MPAKGYRLWAWVKPWQILIGTSPKAGTRTLYEAFQRNFPQACVKDEDTLEIRFANTTIVDVLLPGEASLIAIPKIWIVRHPWDRFKSLWRQKCRDKGRTDLRFDDTMHKMDPHELFTFIKRPCNDNWHWTRQSDIIGMVNRPIVLPAITMLRTESFSEWWKYGDLPIINATEDKGEFDEGFEPLREAVETYYQDDLEMWQVGI